MDNGYVEIIDTTHHRARSSGAVYEHIIVAFLSVGKKLGVSDNMVRKICDIFGIPRHASYYRKLKD